MSPYQHGEVYVLDDGSETDLDLGHYERFTNSPLTRDSNYTTGQIYLSVIDKERRGRISRARPCRSFPTSPTKSRTASANWPGEDVDVVITEIGGTVGDIESQPFLEAIRQFALDVGKENCLYIHLTLVPYLKAAGELKTKPTQHSVGQLREIGIQPDILICRTERSPEPRRPGKDRPVLQRADRGGHRREGQGLLDLRSAAEPGRARAGRADRPQAGPAGRHAWTSTTGATCCTGCAIPSTKSASPWSANTPSIATPTSRSTNRWTTPASPTAPRCASSASTAKKSSEKARATALAGYDGLLVPGGFGERGIEGKVEAIRFARERQIPFFGICLGMQCAVIEFAERRRFGGRPLDGVQQRHRPSGDLPARRTAHHYRQGGTMRLGSQEASLDPSSKSAVLLWSGDHPRTAPPSLRIQQRLPPAVPGQWHAGGRHKP